MQLGRASVIVKPIAIPTEAPVSHTPVSYEVKDGESLKDLAARFHVSSDSIRWSNFSVLKNTSKDVTSGQKIVIPPVDGIAVVAQQGDTSAKLANTYHVDPSAIVEPRLSRPKLRPPGD